MAVRDINEERGRRSEGQRMLDEEDMTRREGQRILHEENMVRHEADQRSLGSLVSELMGELSTLFRREVDLVKLEASEKAANAKTGIIALTVAGVVGFAGLLILLHAAVYGLGQVMALGWAALIVAVATLVVAGIAAMVGMSKLKPEKLTPQRSPTSLREDLDLAKEKANGGHK